MEKTFSTSVAKYSENFKITFPQSGYGCGYVKIPSNRVFYQDFQTLVHMFQPDDVAYEADTIIKKLFKKYGIYEKANFEITHCVIKTTPEGRYLEIGFHSNSIQDSEKYKTFEDIKNDVDMIRKVLVIAQMEYEVDELINSLNDKPSYKYILQCVKFSNTSTEKHEETARKLHEKTLSTLKDCEIYCKKQISKKYKDSQILKKRLIYEYS